ncbi:hypothetical protein BTA51_28520 [Hahella sp. CCB-MM4]|uniref:metallophosphoesterase n=1 Tax=Hahella sp. (strain CCB-MM4) TaxID=1926491 RepID=UPI000B9BF347|nr:metallophosphoesterase [Hahella sp. CCB-MM4]OZG69956.1 hypothetical protein BTA51_28520 [Hahella sp. CCB-MM4]
MSKLQTYQSNLSGRDFICSDIHGHFSLLEEQLSHLDFDKEKDRLFCLGDLIDRGQESDQVIDYLRKPWFFSILGNHELMLIDAMETGNNHVFMQWYSWGGDWAEDFSQEALTEYYEALVELPMAIELHLTKNDPGGKVGLVHAGLPDICDWHTVRQDLSAMDVRDNSTGTSLTYHMLWGGFSGISDDKAQRVDNIDHVFHGHTIVEEMTTVTNRTFMDLGSYKYGRIGIIEVESFLSRMSK